MYTVVHVFDGYGLYSILIFAVRALAYTKTLDRLTAIFVLCNSKHSPGTMTHVEADVKALESPAGNAYTASHRHAGTRVQCDVMRERAHAHRHFRSVASPRAVHRLPGV